VPSGSTAKQPRDIFLFNTLTRSKQRLEPIVPGQIGIYCCGPTVYDYAHIGNLRTYIFEDALVRSLRQAKYAVTHVMNITDVGHLQSDADEGEDKMVLAAQRERRSPWEIARFYENEFMNDCAELNIVRPNVVARATEHIPDMISFISALEQRDVTYDVDGNVYFDVSTFPLYGALRSQAVSDTDAFNRVEVDARKHNQADFVLWFSHSKFPHQIMKWESPWGVGFPGWHIECSAMASKYIGRHIDIHCGGIDHIPIHHTNEIAQSESRFGHRWVNIWMHADFLVLDKGKMSKSEGTFITMRNVRDRGFQPLHFRYLCLTAHYRSPLHFSWDALDGARRGLENLYNRIIALRLAPPVRARSAGAAAEAARRHRDQFQAALADDLNLPIALSMLWAVIKDADLDAASKLALIEEFDQVLGLSLSEAKRSDLPDDVMALIRERERARATGDWTTSDRIRADLAARGVMVMDTKEGSHWYLSD
jgi:cysteinyl-tRNA synthetase